jgi:alkanesulfonate monooxygenase SsuD/methylene tetrahydromethanopterin reductase-like flavin-dependent oxidoreductase (luciferase family)
MKVGVYLPVREGMGSGHHADRTRSWRDLLAMARQVEDAGFDSLWIPDHLLFRWPGVPPTTQGTWEAWSLVAALAATTSRVEIGTMVLCTAFRSPALLAKMADTVDEISGGRLILGLGAGYHEPEFRAFGLHYADRASRFEEAVTIIGRLLRTGACDYAGQHYTVRECELRPRGPRAAGPPIMIATSNPAGVARPRMHRVLAEHADLWNGWLAFWRSWPDAVPPLRATVDAACRDAGREPATLGRTVSPLVVFPDLDPGPQRPGVEPLVGSPDALVAALAGFAREGVTHLQVQLDPATPAAIERLAGVLDRWRRGG